MKLEKKLKWMIGGSVETDEMDWRWRKRETEGRMTD